jgi:N-acetylneuraminic acid mutarotase
VTSGQKCVAAFVATAVLGASGLMLSAQAPQAVGTWAPAGELAESQSGGAAVALEDGRTLIVGGSGADGAPTDRVVIVSPWDNSFFVTGRLLAARVGHTATLLADGRVFVAGGRVDGALVADLELFNVETGASEIVGALAQARAGHAAARLADGTVLIVGGVTVDGAVVATAESFDPATSSTAPLSSGLQSPRAGASATPLVDGRVLVAGGYNGTTDLSSAEIYHPATQTFSLLDTQLSVARSGHTAVLLPNNNSVLVAGGWSNGVPQTAADLFLPAEFPDPYSYGTGSFVATAAMSGARAGAVGGPGHAEGFAFVTGGGSQSQERYRFATIRTDKNDYAPGERAVISGTGWQPGEDVTLSFQEDPAVHDDYVLTVTADAAGDIYWDQWAPEEHDLNVRFYLMARDSVSRAQVTFTDGAKSLGSISVGPQLPDPVSQGSSATYVVTINRAASGPAVSGSFTVLLSLTTALPAGATASFSPNPVTIASASNTGTSTLTISTSATTPVNLAGSSFTVLAVNEAGGGSNNATTTGSLRVASGNSAPRVAFTAGPVVVTESGTAEHAYTFAITDPDAGDSWTFSSGYPTCGTGGDMVAGSASIDNTAKSATFRCIFPDGPTNPTVAVNVQDASGAASNEATGVVTVANVAPTVNAGADRTIDEGSSFAQTGSFTDPGTADTWTATVDYGDGSGSTPLALNPDKTFNLAHAYGDNGTFTVAVTVTDDDGGVGTDTVTVTVKNVAPGVTGSTFTFNPYTGAASAAVSFFDPGWLDTVSPSFNWGGPLAAGLPAVIGPGSAPAVTGTFTSSYTFAPGCITGGISAAVRDDDLGQASYTFANSNTLQVYSVAFVAPLRDGVRNVVKLGNVIPVKLSIHDCNGNPVIDKTLSISVVAGIFSSADVEDGAEVIPTSVSAADSTGLMRLADNHYMYNLATKGLSTGLPYTIIIRAGAQLVATAVVEARK